AGAKAFYGGLLGWEFEELASGEKGTYAICRLRGRDGVARDGRERETGGGGPPWPGCPTGGGGPGGVVHQGLRRRPGHGAGAGAGGRGGGRAVRRARGGAGGHGGGPGGGGGGAVRAGGGGGGG